MIPALAVVAKMMMMPPMPVAPIQQFDLRAQFAEHPMVQRMTREARFDDSMSEFLVRESEPLDVRLAVASPMALADATAAGDAFSKVAFRGALLDKVKPGAERRADLLALAAYLSAIRPAGATAHSRALAEAARKRAPESLGVAMVAAMLRPTNATKQCEVARLMLSPLRDLAIVTDVSDRTLFAYGEIAMQAEDMCRAQGGRR